MPMNTAKLLLLNVLGGSAVDTSASFGVTTSGAQTLTINALTMSAATTVDWGDGSQNVYTGSGARTHNYAGAGTWQVRILEPLNVTAFQLSQTTLVTNANSANLKRMANISHFELGQQPAGSTCTFNSADVVDWRPMNFYLYSMSAGYAGTFDSADVSAWNPVEFRLSGFSSGFSAPISAAADFAGWRRCTWLYMKDAALASTEVDRVLLGMNSAAASRTVTGGSIDLSGSNAAPSGTYASECPPTTGKGAAHSLLNNSCGTVNLGRVFTAITVTGGL